jgi:hypothetical protein
MKSGARTFFGAAKTATKLILPVFKERWLLFIALELVAFLAAQYFRFAEVQISNQTEENLMMLATNAGLSISFDLIWHALFFMVVVITTIELSTKRQSGLKRSTETFQELLIENIRVVARAIFWLPFLIFPALYKYVRLSMVSFVVLSDDEYQAGKVDALKRSYDVTRGHFLLCGLALLLSTLIEPIVANIINGGEISILENPVGATLSMPASLFAELWSMIFLFGIYSSLRSEKNGSEKTVTA